jgi:hypothetical protein
MQNVANSNTSDGFMVTGGSTANVVSRNVGHANGDFDGHDTTLPGSNTWTSNNFGTTSPAGLH